MDLHYYQIMFVLNAQVIVLLDALKTRKQINIQLYVVDAKTLII